MAHKKHEKVRHVQIFDPEEYETGFVILGTTSEMGAIILGNGYGKPFDTEEAAERRMRKADDCYPEFQFLVLPIKGTKMARLEDFE